MNYYDPMFYICSEKMDFSIRLEFTFKYEIDGKILEKAVNTAMKRYPYFSVKLAEKDGDIVAVPNELPVKVFKGKLNYPLGSKEVNYHILVLTYTGKTINFHITHVITDGGGSMPFFKTVLYYYVCGFLGKELPCDGIRTVDSPFDDGEIENPFPEDKMKSTRPFYIPKEKEFFRICDGGYVNDDLQTVYMFRTKEADVMKFSHENDASPCALFSAIMAKAIWAVHPNEDKDLVSAISFNMRPGLESKYNYRMLSSSLPIRYTKKLDSSPVSKICTCTRGAILVQSQPENVLYYAKQKKKQLEELLLLPDIETKHATISKIALEDSVNNTFSVSYVGRVDYGAITEHLESVRIFTDGSTYKTMFIEISSFNGWFYVTLLQGFSNDVYYRTLLRQLEQNGIEYIDDGMAPTDTSKIKLPDCE